MKKILFLIIIAVLSACSSNETKKKIPSSAQFIDEATVKAVIENISTVQPAADPVLLEKCVKHAASLWRDENGTSAEFSEFVDADVKTALAFINLLQQGTHSLEAPYNDNQVAALVSRAEGLLLYLIDISCE